MNVPKLSQALKAFQNIVAIFKISSINSRLFYFYNMLGFWDL